MKNNMPSCPAASHFVTVKENSKLPNSVGNQTYFRIFLWFHFQFATSLATKRNSKCLREEGNILSYYD
jgi:hypothetical protein